MPYTDFHYTPTGTGVISGREVLEQTEDAINDLGTQISGDVQTAIDTANNALNTANTASADAQNAVNTANTAYTAAQNAQNTANTAQNTASNASAEAQNAQNDVNALGNRVTTAENNISQNTSDISGLTTRMGTAEGNITTLQNDVVTAQGTATSAQNTATMARQQAYVLRYSSTAITDNSTIAYSTLDNTDNIKASDKIIDVDGKIFSISSVDTTNETVTVGSALIDLALDSNVMHLSGNETIAGEKTFSSNLTSPGLKSISSTEISGQGSNILSLYSTLVFLNGDPSITARLNFRILGSDGSKSLYPHETGQYVLGLTSRRYANTWTNLINSLNPGVLSFPDLSSGLDISSYINTGNSDNSYTPTVDGYISVRINNSVSCALYAIQGDFYTSSYGNIVDIDSGGYIAAFFMPVTKNVACRVVCRNAGTIVSAKFFPNLGNV